MPENFSRRGFLGQPTATAGAAGLVAAMGVNASGAAPGADGAGSNSQGAEAVPVDPEKSRSDAGPASTSATKQKTLLAIGAHYDDCVFGIPGILLQAARKHYRVVILNIIGDYDNWAPAVGRAGQLRATAVRLASERGMEMRFLNYASMHFDVNADAKRAVAEVVAEVKPDVAFMLWGRDRHPDRSQAVKETLARYRGLACGVQYAEAVWATRPYPCEIV